MSTGKINEGLMMKKFFIEALGCALRELDAEKIKNWLTANGYKFTMSSKDADYIFFVICGLNKERCDDGVNRILAFKKMKAELIVVGCLPIMHPDMLTNVFSGKTVITKEIEKIDELFPDFKVKFKDAPDANKSFVSLGTDIVQISKRLSAHSVKLYFNKLIQFIIESWQALTLGRRLRNIEGLVGGIGFDNSYYSIRISDGCSWSCSYCSMKKAIGGVKSKPKEQLLDEASRGVQQNKFKFNIISSDSGSYGLEMGLSLPILLKDILALDKRITIEFVQDLNPFYFCKYKSEFLELINTGRVKSTSIPFQSGSDRILSLMNRRLDFDVFIGAIKEIRKINSRFKLRTQVIIGFPSETEEDFQKTLLVLKDCRFDEVDLFCYYEGAGTASEKIEPKVPAEVISRRMKMAKEQLKGTPIRFIEN